MFQFGSSVTDNNQQQKTVEEQTKEFAIKKAEAIKRAEDAIKEADEAEIESDKADEVADKADEAVKQAKIWAKTANKLADKATKVANIKIEAANKASKELRELVQSEVVNQATVKAPEVVGQSTLPKKSVGGYHQRYLKYKKKYLENKLK